MQNEESNNYEKAASLSEEIIEKPVEAEETPTPNNPPWNGWIGLSVWILSVVLIVVCPVVLVMPYLLSQNISLSDNTILREFLTTDKTAILLQLLAVIPAHLLTILLAWVVVTNYKRYDFRQTLGWERGGFKIWHAFAVTFFFFALGITLKSLLPSEETEFDRMLKSSQAAVYLVAFFATFTAPLVEEVVYRGILYSALQRKFGVILGVTFVTVLFVAVHIPQYSNNNLPDYSSIILLVLLSLTLTLIRVKTDNLLPCIILHTVFNGIQAVLLVSQPFLQWLYDNYVQKVQENPALIIHFLK